MADRISIFGDSQLVSTFETLSKRSTSFHDILSNHNVEKHGRIGVQWTAGSDTWAARSGVENDTTGSFWSVEINRNTRALTNGRTMTVEELITHEVGHAAFPGPRWDFGLKQEPNVIGFTNKVRSELGLPIRDLDASLSFRPVLNFNNKRYPTGYNGHVFHFNSQCFLAGTMIDMWPLDGDLTPNANGTYNENIVLAAVWQKPIEEVTPEDWVVSYDDSGKLKPGRVTRTFQNHSKHILDVHGLMMTPSHVTYCAKVDGEHNRFADTHAPIIDILRSDGALKKADGTLIRAATSCEVGSKDDEQFWAFLLYEDKDGSERIREKCQLRLGTRWMMPNGHHFSMREYMDNIGIELVEQGPQKGYVRFKESGMVTVFAWTFSGTLPKPEDYVLERSQVTLEEIYEADEWEAIRPQMPTPVHGEAGRSFNQEKTLFAGASSDHLPPNIPHSMRNSPNQPTMSRQQRRALNAKQRKNKSRTNATMH